MLFPSGTKVSGRSPIRAPWLSRYARATGFPSCVAKCSCRRRPCCHGPPIGAAPPRWRTCRRSSRVEPCTTPILTTTISIYSVDFLGYVEPDGRRDSRVCGIDGRRGARDGIRADVVGHPVEQRGLSGGHVG